MISRLFPVLGGSMMVLGSLVAGSGVFDISHEDPDPEVVIRYVPVVEYLPAPTPAPAPTLAPTPTAAPVPITPIPETSSPTSTFTPSRVIPPDVVLRMSTPEPTEAPTPAPTPTPTPRLCRHGNEDKPCKAQKKQVLSGYRA